MKSNVSVGLPIDLLVYEADALRCDELACIDETNPYFAMIRDAWGQGVQTAFDALENPDWKSTVVAHPLRVRSKRYDVLQGPSKRTPGNP